MDGSDDRQRDLLADWDDIIASVANYFSEHGWETGGPVLAEAVLDPDAPVTIDPGNLALNETVAGLKAKGVDFDTPRRPRARRCCSFPRRPQDGPAYRVGFNNF